MVFLTDSLFPTLWFVVELKQILIFSGEFLSLPLHFRAVIIMSDIENGRGGGSFYSVQDREGVGLEGRRPLVVPMWSRGSLPFAQQEGRCVPLLLVRGYSGPVQKMVQQLCQIVKVLVVLSYRVRAQLQEQCRVISLKYACVACNSYN